MTFNFFVLPFLLGIIFLFASVIRRFIRWIKALDQGDKNKLLNGFRSTKLLNALKEIFFESLIHRKMFRKNKLLGYMHMSFAFGWLMLIVMGNLESRIYSGWWINPPYYPIFLKFFIHDKRVLPFEIFTVPGFFRFMMDLLLVFVLSGLVLAIIKRSRSKWFGVIRTTELQLADKVAMTCLWLIFPLRLIAESFTAGAYGYGGGFVFDCRALPNPGRLPEFQKLTGKDQKVIHYLESYPDVEEFLKAAFSLVDQSVNRYMERKFSHLSVQFGCTGGQHRSVYNAERMAAHLTENFPVRVVLHHREQDNLG